MGYKIEAAKTAGWGASRAGEDARPWGKSNPLGYTLGRAARAWTPVRGGGFFNLMGNKIEAAKTAGGGRRRAGEDARRGSKCNPFGETLGRAARAWTPVRGAGFVT
jgi:hypothetical protein